MEIKPVIILGAKGLGKAALEIFKRNEVVIYGFLDDDTKLHNTEIDYVSVLGRPDDDGFLKFIGQKCDAFVANDDNRYRKSLVKMLNERRKVMPINAIHPQATLATSAEIGYGNFINQGASIGAFCKIGSHCLIHSGAIIDYDTQLADFVQVGSGSQINSGVVIEEGAFIGSGVTVVSGIKIGANARVGAGSVVIEDVKTGATVFGNPAKEMGK
jgi:sugar O-acyltransferase (sialic acid O-acetyltransferase NeuD family)